MNIDSFTIPCPFCQSTLFLQDVSTDDEELICCESCATIVSPNIFISGGINALAGKLMKENIFVESHLLSIKPKWTWCMDRRKYTHKQFDSFEEAVLDAWETLKREEK